MSFTLHLKLNKCLSMLLLCVKNSLRYVPTILALNYKKYTA